jgi:hypothetical protein
MRRGTRTPAVTFSARCCNARRKSFPKNHTLNPTFELTYWRWALETAQQWRTRLGLPREKKWDDVLNGLAKPPWADGKYLFTETTPDSYTNPNGTRTTPPWWAR